MLRGGDFHELPGAGFGSVLHVEVIADEEQEWGTVSKLAAAQDGMAITTRSFLGDEMEAIGEFAGPEAIGRLVTRTDYQADFVDARFEYFLGEDAESGFLDAIAVHEGLERECGLGAAGGGDDGLLDFHGSEGVFGRLGI
jgi:hypothetical protein